MDITWNKVKLEDELLLKHYYGLEQSRSCEYTFANNYLWSPFYHYSYAIIEDALVFLSGDHGFSVSFPLGTKNIKPIMEILMDYFKQVGKLFKMHMVTEEQFARLEEVYPGQFQIEDNRNLADYVYLSEKLGSLSGKKLHGKRNHINRFVQEHPDWSYEDIDDSNREECEQVAKDWRIKNGCEDDPEKHMESCVALNSLKMLERLELKGGLIRTGGKVVAFSVGEPVNDDTFVVHIEKAYADVQGAYPMINQQFVLHEAKEFIYINREEDTGDEGLRKSKLSYYPEMLISKGYVTKIDEL